MNPERWQQIERLYHSALEREPDHRDSFLAAACGDDDDLRREVESLLAQNPSALTPVGRTEWEAVASKLETRTILTPDSRLGAYQILGSLREGAAWGRCTAHWTRAWAAR